MRAARPLIAGVAVLGGAGGALYKHRVKLRVKALRLLAHGSPVVLNARISEGTLEMNDCDGAVIANLDLVGVDYEPLRKAAQALVDKLDAKASGAVGVKVTGTMSNAHFLDSSFSRFGTGVQTAGVQTGGR